MCENSVAIVETWKQKSWHKFYCSHSCPSSRRTEHFRFYFILARWTGGL